MILPKKKTKIKDKDVRTLIGLGKKVDIIYFTYTIKLYFCT